MVHLANVTFGVKISREKKLTEKEETLKDIILAGSAQEAQHHFKRQIHGLRSTSSGISKFVLNTFPTYISEKVPGCQDPRGFIYIVLSMVIRSLNEDPNFFPFFDPLSMQENTGSFIFRNIPDGVLLKLMDRVVKDAGLSQHYFTDFKKVQAYVLEFKYFFEDIRGGSNPYSHLWEYGDIFKDLNFHKSFDNLDKKRSRQYVQEGPLQKTEKYIEFLKTYKNEISEHQSTVTLQKHTRGFIYRILILAILERNRTHSPDACAASDALIQQYDPRSQDTSELLSLANRAAIRLELGENYFKSFKEIADYSGEFIQFMFNGAKLQQRYSPATSMTRQFIADSAIILDAEPAEEALPRPEGTAALIARRITSTASSISLPNIALPVSVTENPAVWQIRRAGRQTKERLLNPKETALMLKKIFKDVRHVIAYIMTILWIPIIQCLTWCYLEGAYKGKKA